MQNNSAVVVSFKWCALGRKTLKNHSKSKKCSNTIGKQYAKDLCQSNITRWEEDIRNVHFKKRLRYWF